MLGHAHRPVKRGRMPDVKRPEPGYVQIANHYRDAILAGELAPGDRLPSINDIAGQWHVARETASKAISRLQVERAVYSTPRGTFVSSDDHITRTPGDRIRGPRPARIGRGEKVTLNEASIVLAPNYVAELLGIEPGSMVIRREETTTLRGKPRMLSVDWIPTRHVMAEAELLGPPTPEGPEHVIATVTGRHVTHAQDHLESREADTREATTLAIPAGTPILAGTHVWSDQDGVILYGEWVMPPKQVITYSYAVENRT
jgi:GntR family transcriptional regulator